MGARNDFTGISFPQQTESHIQIFSVEDGVVLNEDLGHSLAVPKSDGAVATESSRQRSLEQFVKGRKFVLDVLALNEHSGTSVGSGGSDWEVNGLYVWIFLEVFMGNVKIRR